jgi:drug/metabolite transporter (DMT)-like permease
MTLLAIILVFISAILHASWNVYSKAYGNPLSFMFWALVWSSIVYVPLFIAACIFTPFSPLVWCLSILSGLLCSIYFLALGSAYKDGLVSVAYPIARAFPILVVTWAGTFLGEHPSAHGLFGIILVVTGCFFLPFREFKAGTMKGLWKSYATKSAFWALVAALVTSIYSIIDKSAAMHLSGPTYGLSMLGKLNYVYVQNLVSLIGLWAIVRFRKLPMDSVPRAHAIIFGIIFLVSYGLVMLALATDSVAYVVAFRQISIVIATIASMVFSEKFFSWPRFVGVLQIFAGVVLVGLG